MFIYYPFFLSGMKTTTHSTSKEVLGSEVTQMNNEKNIEYPKSFNVFDKIAFELCTDHALMNQEVSLKFGEHQDKYTTKSKSTRVGEATILFIYVSKNNKMIGYLAYHNDTNKSVYIFTEKVKA